MNDQWVRPILYVIISYEILSLRIIHSRIDHILYASYPQNDVEEVNLKYKTERAALEKQYELLRAPILEKRKDIVSGDVEVELEGTDSGEYENESMEWEYVDEKLIWSMKYDGVCDLCMSKSILNHIYHTTPHHTITYVWSRPV